MIRIIKLQLSLRNVIAQPNFSQHGRVSLKQCTWSEVLVVIVINQRYGTWFSLINLQLHDIPEIDLPRMAALMEKYHDLPMDLADASLVVTAEYYKLNTIWTLDKHFYAYRLRDGAALEIVR